jgi:hypothetical protein
MAIEIVSFPINSMVIFYSYVNVYQRVDVIEWIMIGSRSLVNHMF